MSSRLRKVEFRVETEMCDVRDEGYKMIGFRLMGLINDKFLSKVGRLFQSVGQCGNRVWGSVVTECGGSVNSRGLPELAQN